MLKKYLIITLFLFAYTIVLGHSIIPHHHHVKGHKKVHSSHHHHQDQDQDHHHHHDHGDEDKDSGLAHNFGNYMHSGNFGGSGDFHYLPYFKISCNVIASVYILPLYDFKINSFESPPPIGRHPCDPVLPVPLQLSSKGLRAPPCLFM